MRGDVTTVGYSNYSTMRNFYANCFSISLPSVWKRMNSPWASCQIRKIAGAHAPGMPGTFSPSSQVSDPDMHHGTCLTHVPWCMPGSLTSGFLWNWRRGGNVPGIPGACATCNFPYLVRGPYKESVLRMVNSLTIKRSGNKMQCSSQF